MRPQTQFFTHILEREMSYANNRRLSQSERFKHYSTRKTRFIFYFYVLHKLKLSNRRKDSWHSNLLLFLNRSNNSWRTAVDDERHLQLPHLKQITFTWMLTSDFNHNATQKHTQLNDIHPTRTIVHFTCQHRSSWWSERKFAMREGDL